MGVTPQTFLSLESQVQRHEGLRRQAIVGAGDRESQAQAALRSGAAGQGGSEGTLGNKLVRPAQRRQAARYLVERGVRSERRACELVGISRSVVRYQVKAKDDDPLRRRLRELAVQYSCYGYPALHPILQREGWVTSEKRTYRIYREEPLQVPRRRGKKLPRQRRFRRQQATRPNQRWSMDLMSDQLANGRRFRVLNIVDDYTRECKGQIVDFSISGVVDNGPELTSKAMFLWSERAGVRLQFIDPGKLIQNAFVESFNARFRDTCLNEYWFTVWRTLGRPLSPGGSITIVSGLTVLYSIGHRRRLAKNGTPREPWKTLRASHWPKKWGPLSKENVKRSSACF